MRPRSKAASIVCAFLLSLTTSLGAQRPEAATARPTAAVSRLRQDLDQTLNAPALERSHSGVLVTSLTSGETLFSRNANKLLMPASTLKLVTVAAAAERLGWNYTYETRLLSVGPISDGELAGDLLVVGTGDPAIVDRDGMAPRLFAAWAEELKRAGVRTISGRIVGDNSAFDGEPLGFGWSWDDLTEGFSAGVSALQYNENRAQLWVTPSASIGRPPSTALVPSGSGLAINNRAATGKNGEAATLKARRLPGSNVVELSGGIALGGEARMFSVSVDNPTLFFVTALREALTDAGIAVTGPAVTISDAVELRSRADARPLLTYRSPPLSAIMQGPMKFSVNIYEETLLKTLGMTAGTPTFEGGRTIVKSTVTGWDVPPGALILADGSGLSRYNYVTPTALVQLLSHIDRSDKLRGPFESSLPVAGRDGTLAARMVGTAAEGKVVAKTGAMSGVRSLAGFVTTDDGERLAFAILANNFDAPGETIVRVIDGIAVRLAQFSRR